MNGHVSPAKARKPDYRFWRVAAIVAILVAGCGSDPPTPTTQPPQATSTPTATIAATATPVPIAKRMNAICKRWQPRADALNARFRALTNQGEYAAAAGEIRKGEAVQRRVDDQLAELEPPTNQADVFRRYVGARRRLTALLPDLADAVEAADAGRAQDINEQIGRVRQARLDASLDLAADECR